VEVDPDVATVNDLVEGVLRMELGYGEEISITHGTEEIYDGYGELDDNLEKKLSHWGIGQNSFLTVTDYSKEDARVDIEIIILEK
jgi:ubiquitin-like 1-activating enzyme E1 B